LKGVFTGFNIKEHDIKDLAAIYTEERLKKTLAAIDVLFDPFMTEAEELIDACNKQRTEELARREKEDEALLQSIKTTEELLAEVKKEVQATKV